MYVPSLVHKNAARSLLTWRLALACFLFTTGLVNQVQSVHQAVERGFQCRILGVRLDRDNGTFRNHAGADAGLVNLNFVSTPLSGGERF
jgi:hypothetical protein